MALWIPGHSTPGVWKQVAGNNFAILLILRMQINYSDRQRVRLKLKGSIIVMSRGTREMQDEQEPTMN